MAISGIGDYAGTVFAYFQKAWMNMQIRDFMTPLTNSKYLVKATIPAESGQGVKFRYFPEWNVEATSSSNSAPKEYNENTEPSAGNTLVPVLVEAPLTFFASYTDLGNFAMATDPTDLLAKSKENFRLQLRRWMHQIANQRCVVKLTDGLRADSGATVTAGNIPSAFSTIYAGGLATFGQLVADSVISPDDIKRAVAMLRQNGVPPAVGSRESGSGRYVCVIDDALVKQLKEDEHFRRTCDTCDQQPSLTNVAYRDIGGMVDWEGCIFVEQDDPYRCHLPAAGGTLAVRRDTGAVHVCHILGKAALGYVEFGGKGSVARSRSMPSFHIVDTSKTGTGPSIGFRVPFQVAPMRSDWALNLAGTSQFNESIGDL